MSTDSPLVFITGASSGIGQALALRYYQAGYRLALVARRVDVMAQWAQEAQLDASRYCTYCADVSSIDSIVNAGAQCLAQQGLPAVVIANAGISVGVDTAYRADLDAMAQLFATNNIGLASVAGIRGLPGNGAYCASKAAVISYCESLRGELRGTGVRVLTLSPGYIDTPLTRKNKYPIPFLMSAAAFADKAFRAIGSNATYRVIPWQMGWVAKLLRLLPNRLFDRLLAGQPRKHRTPQ